MLVFLEPQKIGITRGQAPRHQFPPIHPIGNLHMQIVALIYTCQGLRGQGLRGQGLFVFFLIVPGNCQVQASLGNSDLMLLHR